MQYVSKNKRFLDPSEILPYAGIKKDEVVADFGCGNGRLLKLLDGKKIHYLGVDISAELIEVASKSYNDPNIRFEKITYGQESLALSDNFFNTIYTIAVFHHLPSKDYRQRIAEELFRSTKPGGIIVVDVWNLWQKKYFKNIIRNWKNKLMGNSQLDWNDCYISFMGEDGKKFQRFHHAFTKGELRKLFSNAGFKVEKCQVVGKWHIVLVGKK